MKSLIYENGAALFSNLDANIKTQNELTLGMNSSTNKEIVSYIDYSGDDIIVQPDAHDAAAQFNNITSVE